jgi:hypothetical protein
MPISGINSNYNIVFLVNRILLISFHNLKSEGRSSSPVGYGIGIAEVVGSNPTRSTLYYSGMILHYFELPKLLTSSIMRIRPDILVNLWVTRRRISTEIGIFSYHAKF